MISAFQAVFGSLFHATRNFRRKNYFNKVTRALCQNKFLTNLFPSSRHSEQSKESLKKIAKPHDCIPFNTGKILRKTGHFSQNQRFLEKVVKQVQDDSVVKAFDKNHRAAFTLAEVLITFGIIGIVAALTIPTLVKNYEKFVLETKFKKAKSVLFQTIKLWQIDENNILTNLYHFNDDIILRDYLLKYLKGNIVQTPAELKPYFTSIKNSTTEIHYCPVSCCLHPLYNNRMIETSDGIMYGACARDNVIHFYFDLNGYYKGPNKWGIDLFDFDYNNENKLYMFPCASFYCTNYFDRTPTNVNDGLGCTACASKHRDYFKKIDW